MPALSYCYMIRRRLEIKVVIKGAADKVLILRFSADSITSLEGQASGRSSETGGLRESERIL